MPTFIDEILEDINWRISELTTIKTLPFRYSLLEEHKMFLIKYSIPSIYAIWEGFIKSVFAAYINELNALSLSHSDVSIALLTHHIDQYCNFSNARMNFESKLKLVNQLNQLFTDDIAIVSKIPTESNVNYKVVSNLLERFCIKGIDEIPYKHQLDKLLLFRNKIAHGENSLKVESSNLEEFCMLVQNLMFDIVLNIQDAFTKKTYLKLTPLSKL